MEVRPIAPSRQPPAWLHRKTRPQVPPEPATPTGTPTRAGLAKIPDRILFASMTITPFRLAKQMWHLVPESLRTAMRSSPALGWLKQRIPRAAADQHDEMYNADYYRGVDDSTGQSAPTIVECVVRDLHPRSLLDVGCGTGAMLVEFRRHGVDARGLEYGDAALKLCRSRGLPVKRFDLERDGLRAPDVAYDVVLSTEVAEHLPASSANRYLELLVSQSGTVVFTAATPGQGGLDHVNEQPHDYWIAKFATRGYRMDEPLSRRWRGEWEGKVSPWFAKNVMVFRRGRA